MVGSVSGVLGGKFENAVIREMDAFNHPERNQTPHPYYLALNRDPGKPFFERAATFLTVFDETFVPLADWESGALAGSSLRGSDLGIRFNPAGGEARFNEHDPAITSAVDDFLNARRLPPQLYDYISGFDAKVAGAGVDPSRLSNHLESIKGEVARHYLSRLVLQIREAAGSRFLVLDEVDIELLGLFVEFIRSRETRLPFEFPDVPAKTILGQDFCGGLLNFAPQDAASVVAIRQDPMIADYAAEVRERLTEVSSMEGERALLRAMNGAYQRTKKLRSAMTAFEVRGWLAKPITYIPVIGNVASAINDAADLAEKGVETALRRSEWHLLAARAQQINIEEYLARKGNML